MRFDHKKIKINDNEDQEKITCFGFDALKIIRVINVITGILLIVLPVFYILDIFSALGDLIYCPGRFFINFFMIIFGMLVIGSAAKLKCISTNFKFLTNETGKGCFYIFVGGLLF